MKRLWVNENGMTVCDDHLGFYATDMLARRPDADELRTPLDHWQRMSPEDAADWVQWLSGNARRPNPTGCEQCDAA